MVGRFRFRLQGFYARIPLFWFSERNGALYQCENQRGKRAEEHDARDHKAKNTNALFHGKPLPYAAPTTEMFAS